MRRGVEAREPENREDEIDDGEDAGSGAGAAFEEDGKAAGDHDCGGDERQQLDGGDVVAEGLDGLMGAIEIVPEEIGDAGSGGCQAEEDYAGAHGAVAVGVAPRFFGRGPGGLFRVLMIRFASFSALVTWCCSGDGWTGE